MATTLAAIKEQVYTFHSDCGHAWLEVPMQYLKDLGIYDEITYYSYRSKDRKTAYLEEDCDAPKFLNKVYGDNNYQTIKGHIEEVYDGDDSFIRRLPSISYLK